MRKALLIVDVQRDFCPGGSLAVRDGDKIIEPINALYLRATHSNLWRIMASRDWHPEVTKHFAKDNNGQGWPVHCVQNTDGAKFHKDLCLPPKKNIFSKGFRADENNYSAFDGVADNGVSLAEYLDLAYVTEVYVCGLATDYCVKSTALDAVKLGYKTHLLTDCIKAVDTNPGDGDRAIEEMKSSGVIITTSQDVMK